MSIALRRFFSSARVLLEIWIPAIFGATDPNGPRCASHCLSSCLLMQIAVCAAFEQASRHPERVLYEVPWAPRRHRRVGLRANQVTSIMSISDTTLSREDMPLTKARMRVRPTVTMLLWPTSAIGVWLLLDFNRQFNKSSDCFSTRWEVGLAAAPVVYRPQKLLRYPHLKRAILRALRWAATRPNAAAHFCTFCIDKNASKE